MADVMSIVTDRVIAALEEGTIPWHKPWVAPDRGAYNRVSGKKYNLHTWKLIRMGEEVSFEGISFSFPFPCSFLSFGSQ